MPSVVQTFDLNATRVPIVIPLGAASAFGVVQLFLGGDPFIILMSVAAITITFLPLHLYGRDIYSMFAILFGFKYVLAALVAKTFYGQPLQSNLFNPHATYTMVLALMIVETAILMAARKFDPGTTLFPFPNDPKSLRRLALISFSLGFIAMLYIGVSAKQTTISAGPAYIIAASLGSLCFLGIIAEAISTVERSGRQELLSPLLGAMLFLVLMTVLALNMRTFFATAIISVALVAFIYKVIKLKYIVVIGLVGVFFLTFLSPLTLYLRAHRDLPFSEFATFAAETGVRMATDANFRKTVHDANEYLSLHDSDQDPYYDYFGDRSNVMNRIAFVGLLDAVYEASKYHKPLGFASLKQTFKSNVPTFLGNVKNPWDLSDWLAWQMGMEDPDFTSYLNFGLPMEGVASWGPIGLVVYPILFMFPLLLAFARLSSFRIPFPLSIYFFGNLQNGVLEGTSDGFVGDILRDIPITSAVIFGLYFIFFRGKSRSYASVEVGSN